MAKTYDNTNRGVLFKNEEKESDKHPDYKGKLNANGVDYWLSAWINETDEGAKYMSLSIQPKEQQRPQAPARPQKPKPATDDSIPF